MRITRLEIFGFKSFVDRFVLDFDCDLIGIVGPNGCGKSNIVDALRWVLGETHAKQLRGGVLEDLIFNGSDSRRALGMAEVSIFLQPDHAALRAGLLSKRVESDSAADVEIEHATGLVPLAKDIEVSEQEDSSQQTLSEYRLADSDRPLASLEDIPGLFQAAEVQLTRRLYRSGESEFFINRVPCRLADMVEFYRLVGLGSRGLSIVQQGQIGQLISRKPSERRELLEEAAGISGFRARLEAAQRRLDKTDANMARLSDLKAEVERQTRSLRRLARRAEKRAELKEELHQSQREVFRLRCGKLKVELESSIRSEEEISRDVVQFDAEVETLETAQSEVRAELSVLDQELAGLRARRDELLQKLEAQQTHEREILVKLGRLDSELKLVSEREYSLSGRAKSGDGEAVELSSQIELLSAELSEIENTVNQRRK